MMFAPSLSASLSYTHTGVPSTVSNSSGFHDVEDILSSTNHEDEATMSYAQSLELSFQISLPGDAIVLHQEKIETAAPQKRHRRHKSDGFVLLPKAHSSLKKKPGHNRANSLELFLQSIPESPTDVVTSECDKSLEGFVANNDCAFNHSCATDLMRKHRRYNSDSLFLTV